MRFFAPLSVVALALTSITAFVQTPTVAKAQSAAPEAAAAHGLEQLELLRRAGHG
jgi:hypothetical protein